MEFDKHIHICKGLLDKNNISRNWTWNRFIRKNRIYGSNANFLLRLIGGTLFLLFHKFQLNNLIIYKLK